jgi:phosphohistidine phosphatase
MTSNPHTHPEKNPIGQANFMTVRTLVLLRHAKAQHPAGVADIDRPLTDRGHADATAAGAWLSNHGFVPDLVICSPAKRTRQTWHGVALALTTAPEVRYDERLYSGRARDMLSAIMAIEANVATALVVGHNPTVSEVSAMLDPSADSDAPDGMRTCAIAVHEITGPWSETVTGQAPVLASCTARA